MASAKKTTQPKIKIVLLGKVGAGKSSTGNSLSEKSHFDESNYTMSETIAFNKHSESDVNGYTFIIYDTQGLMDAKPEEFESIKETMENMDKLIKNCDDISVFLLVYNFTTKFSQEDQKCVSLLECTFGKQEFYKRCIIVVTRGDLLEGDFNEWLDNQEKDFASLIFKCQKRVVLMCNKLSHENNKKTTENLRTAIIGLHNSFDKTYSKLDFDQYEKDRLKFLLDLEIEKTNLTRSYKEDIKKIMSQATVTLTQASREKIMQDIAVLRNKIKMKDQGTGRLKKYLDKLDTEERNVPNVPGKCLIS
ncbi:PHLOEM PROTEIN 2-LIKE A3 [Biomphalaria pfeifferi]|uniref:PHLOEM PROTEIN 2-LIKE A3 n=1 Tax=Biomphalaria pfeifferi TaxID=112525 RepID=A0AAD8B0X5_BIOPF|nr:PHLOEM PROTEIN 2-LIKE A3 [Biomphalaria pfeifferi]